MSMSRGWSAARNLHFRIPRPTVLLLVCLCALAPVRWAQAGSGGGPDVLRIRHFTGPDYTRVVLDLSRPCSYEIREVAHPRRIAVNVRKGSFRIDGSIPVKDGLVNRIRRNEGDDRVQVVLDLDRPYTFKSFSLPAADGRPDRVVIDVFPRSAESPAPPDLAVRKPPLDSPRSSSGAMPGKTGLFTVIIDPGHGGLDPGAIRSDLQEKHVVLDVSREMARLINQLPGYRAVLTRNTDHYPSLSRRVSFARENEGDLFLSVHCNTHKRKSVAGMEVYFLSLQGATDREARELADKENAADMVGLDSRQENDDLVMNILMDLKMSQVLHASANLADHLLEAADRSEVVSRRRAKQAQFQVLHNLAMPSALIEIAYLSNPKDYKVLASNKGREALAATLVEGVLSWRRDGEALARLGKEMPTFWTRQYAVRRGDSLWDLARRHGTTVDEIERRNNLRSRSISVGQVLSLPDGEPRP